MIGYTCPSCGQGLTRCRGQHGIYWHCPSCSGRLAGIAPLRKQLHPELLNELWRPVREKQGPELRTCPSCRRRMREVRPEHTPPLPALDLCGRCHMIWFDAGEFEVLPQLPTAPAEKLSPAARQAHAVMQVALEHQQQVRNMSFTGEDVAWWQYLPALLGLPVESCSMRCRNPAWVTWGLAAVIVLVALFVQGSVRVHYEAVWEWGLRPTALLRHAGLTLLSYAFLHGGWWHLLSNVYFLLIFGDNVEERIGRRAMLLLFFSAVLFSGLCHALLSPHGDLPLVGASGGVSGLLTFYALSLPWAGIAFLFLFMKWIWIPAWAALCLWILLQVFGVVQQVEGLSNVSAMAHMGGAAVGFVFWLAFRQTHRI